MAAQEVLPGPFVGTLGRRLEAGLYQDVRDRSSTDFDLQPAPGCRGSSCSPTPDSQRRDGKTPQGTLSGHSLFGGRSPRSLTVSTSTRRVSERPVRDDDNGVALHNLVCKIPRMATNLAIDDKLLNEAQKVGGHRTKKDTVNEALREYIQRRQQAKVVDLFGTIEFDRSYDYKKQRRRS